MLIEHNLDFGAYLADPAISSHRIKAILRSPLHYLRNVAPKKSAATEIGTAFHLAATDSAAFLRGYVRYGGDRRSKDFKDFKALNTNKKILSEDEYGLVIGMVESVSAHPVARQYLVDGESEVSLFWNEDGVACKARIDLLRPNAIIELKTTRDPAPVAFARQAYNLGYFTQAAWYRHAVQSTVGGAPLPVVIIAVESVPPYDCVVYTLPECALDAAWSECELALKIYRDCVATNRWPGISSVPLELNLPPWAYREDDSTVLSIGGEEIAI
jgi:hypothetical protein